MPRIASERKVLKSNFILKVQGGKLLREHASQSDFVLHTNFSKEAKTPLASR